MILYPRQTQAETEVLSGWDLAISSTLFLQGVLCAQFANYTNVNQRDSMRMKFFVAGLALLTTLKTLQSLAIMWIQNVVLFEDLEAASTMWETHWVSKINLILEATVAFYVQVFFCRRLWVISQNNLYIVITCATLFSFGILAAVAANVLPSPKCLYRKINCLAYVIKPLIPSNKRVSHFVFIIVAAHLATVVCGDLLLTGSTVFYLLRHSNNSLSRGPTAPILNSLLRMTIQATPAALCALINFGSTLGELPTWVPRLLMVDAITNMVLPQLYAWSAMWTLNSREEIYLARDSPCTVNLAESLDSSPAPETPQHSQMGAYEK
ncbi:hypothetical protein K438DRAFT_1969682 [Mycena galopus ATCC 62051]|nr:hypothetical protein K438DRAFT_1969682 [Mycena galopus ATCC 62051]